MRSMKMRLSKKYFLKKLKYCAHSRFLFMCSASSGYGRRTIVHGAGSISLLYTTAEIEFNTAKNYRNTQFDEEKWWHAPFMIDILLPIKKRDEAR